jgi:uncharacterized RDD family membrane protein YckC
MKIRPVGAELFHADGRTDVTKQVIAFRNFAKALKNVIIFDFYLLEIVFLKLNNLKFRKSGERLYVST